MYSIHNEGISAIAEKFLKTLKNKIYKYMTSISKNVYIDKLYGIVVKYNMTCHSTIKMKPVDVKSITCIKFSEEISNEDTKFKIFDIVRISKYKNIFVKGHVPNWSEEIFVIKKVKNTVPWTYVSSDLKGKENVGKFLKKNCKKQIRAEKVIKRKGDKLCVK